ncbi:MAG: Spy/CpxP family protein refolding chaperone [Oscillospiraceae bacterium]|jgi:hypothetical protein|nr:Spy/CpxP family protein refolding chaperone [Oscillospiraceae bacterium]
MINKALSPVRGRIRQRRALAYGLWGLLAGAAGCLALAGAAFFVPIAGLWRYLLGCFAACPLLGALGAVLWPIPVHTAARHADACGLKERVRTALAFKKEDSAMVRLQRADAEAALASLRVSEAMPLRADRRIWLSALGLALAAGILLLIPNPQGDVLRARDRARQNLAAQADLIEKAATQIEKAGLTEEEIQELRRITSDMAEALRKADDPRDALAALDQKQEQMDRLKELISERQAMQAEMTAYMEQLSQSLTPEQMAEMATAMAESLAGMQSMDSAAAQAMMAALSALNAGLSEEAKQALANALAGMPNGNLAAGSASAATAGMNLDALMQMARTGAAQSGGSGNQSGGSGTGGAQSGQGQGAGGGAGQGSTNLDMGYSWGLQPPGGQEGDAPHQDRIGQYEAIYDPTRLGGDAEASYVEGEKGKGENQQIQLGQGVGDMSGQVPYPEVIGEYQEAAAQAARRQNLPETMQDWVNRYFSELTE